MYIARTSIIWCARSSKGTINDVELGLDISKLVINTYSIRKLVLGTKRKIMSYTQCFFSQTLRV